MIFWPLGPGIEDAIPLQRAVTRRLKEDDMLYVLLWLLGVPLSLILILFLIGIGR